MRLSEVARAVDSIGSDDDLVTDPVVTGVAFDSREVRNGDLFCCIPGTVSDGHDYADAAVAAGASALVVEHSIDLDIAQLVVSSVRDVIGAISSAVYANPSADLDVIGVTGTNGKTTTTFFIEAILVAAGLEVGLTGTIETHLGATIWPVRHTTPEAPELHALLRRMVDAGVDAVAMEVSSHALDQGRVGGVEFVVGAFTNLTQDHLDYHADMEDYFAAKRRLFDPAICRRAVVNIDDPYGRRLVDHCGEVGLDTLLYAVLAGESDSEDQSLSLDVTVRVVSIEPDRLELCLDVGGSTEDVQLDMGGEFNASNVACAAACAVAVGVDLETIAAGLETMSPVPGRFEPIVEGQSFGVVVDYAHTPDSVVNVLRSARHATGDGRLICVIGCGGDRDRAKRPLMGAAAGQMADHVIVTSDNPRSEDPLAIIDQILMGMDDTRATVDVIEDRRKAIAAAISSASPGDLVVIAGKGHERGQEVAGVVYPFDDRDVARSELRRLTGRRR